MSGVSFPVTRPIGRALVVANPSSRPSLVQMLTRMGFECGECDDPYSATLELARHRLAYRAVVLSLSSLFREEILLITAVKRRFPHLEIWLTHIDGRQAALAESIRLGADGLINEEGPHRLGAAVDPPLLAKAEEAPQYLPLSQAFSTVPVQPSAKVAPEHVETDAETVAEPAPVEHGAAIGEPVLSADELRALLQDQPAPMPPGEATESPQR